MKPTVKAEDIWLDQARASEELQYPVNHIEYLDDFLAADR